MSFVGKAIKSSSTVELQGIRLEKNSNFESHIENYSYFSEFEVFLHSNKQKFKQRLL